MPMSWPAEIIINTSPGPLHGTLRPPGSKSITNRALICAALANGTSVLRGALDSEDTRVMLDSLRRLGFQVQEQFQHTDPTQRTITITGQGGRIPVTQADLFIANSGTSVRFLTALVATATGRYTLDGTARMRERPIQDLLDSLQAQGIQASSIPQTGCPPVLIQAAGLPGGTVSVRGNVSSQFLSALLLVAPYAQTPLTLTVNGELVSQPYIEITLAVMRSFGVTVAAENLSQFSVPQQQYQALDYHIEPDASAASYWFAAAAITGGKITVPGLGSDSLQGDVDFVEVLRRMGCIVEMCAQSTTVTGGPLHGIDVEMNAISDTVQTLAVVALFASSPTRIRGVAHNRFKETDRIGNLAIELRKLGAQVEEHHDGLTIMPRPLHGATLATYHDHRMAMSLALAGLRTQGVIITDPSCVEKTYPEYFTDLQRLQSSTSPQD